MADLILFGTEGCHLCEEAEALLVQAGLSFETRDIIDDEQAQQRYAVRIPVLLNSETGQELGWPFDVQQLSEFVR
jgi:glutaredoxin